MKVVLMHGKDTDPSRKWYPWFISEMKERGIEVIAPALPKPNNPVMSEWLDALDKTKPNEKTILVGHSRGGVAIFRWLENLAPNQRVKKVILLATNSGLESKRAVKSESNFGFYTQEGYNFEEIKKHCDNFVVMHSKDDPWVPFEQGVENAKGLGAKFLQFDHYKHFGTGVDKIPELLTEIA